MSKLSLTFISDTHGFHKDVVFDEIADVLVHTGDFSNGKHKQTLSFLKWFSEQPHQYKIFIAGNHDKWFEDIHYERNDDFRKELFKEYNIVYLCDDSVYINDIKFYGSPWSVQFFDWSFMKEDSKLREIYDKIPLDTNVLLSHTPPYGILDKTYQGEQVGSKSLTNRIEELKDLKIVSFGHIHESYGTYRENGVEYINSSLFDYYQKSLKEPIIFKI